MTSTSTEGKPRRIVFTGGPGAGKTGVLELGRRHFSSRVLVLQEAASIVFGGGFPRHREAHIRAAAQRAIYHVQDELERIGRETLNTDVILCDRGTLDGLAYWPNAPSAYFSDLETTLEKELARYEAVIHLRTPTKENGYHKDALRIEAAAEADAIDRRLLEVWEKHPRRFIIESTHAFLDKARRAITLVEEEMESTRSAT